MKIAVIGPGAIGCLLGAYLSKANDVWLLDHNPERAGLLHQNGLVLEKNNLRTECPLRATVNPRLIGPAELILLCVKAGKVEDALRTVRPLVDRNSLLLTFQNGIGHLPLLPALPEEADWGLGVTSHGATLIGPGHVLHKGQGMTRIGLSPVACRRDDKAGNKLRHAAEILTAAGIETEPVPDILNHVWAKLLVNLGINALTAIHKCPNGALLQSAETMAIMEAAVLEGKNVAGRIGISLAVDPVKATREVCLATANNISSMLQDVRARRVTEIDAINGALVKKAAELGIPTPVNEKLVRQIKDIERNYLDFT